MGTEGWTLEYNFKDNFDLQKIYEYLFERISAMGVRLVVYVLID